MTPAPPSRHRPRALGVLLGLLLVVVGLPALGVTGAATAAAGAPAAPAAAAAGAQDLWTPTSLGRARSTAPRAVRPRSYDAYSLDATRLSTTLAGTPILGARGSGTTAPATRIAIPSPSGDLVEFAVREDSVMQAGLQAAHPDLRSYAGTAVGDPTTTVRMDVGALGFHAAVRDGDGLGAWYVDPAYVGSTGPYLSYLGSSLPAEAQPVESADPLPTLPGDRAAGSERAGTGTGETTSRRASAGDPQAGASVVRRTYRLALLSDPTYAAFVSSGCSAGSNACVLSAKQTLLNRLDQVYGTDLAVRMVLIDATDSLNLDTAAKATLRDGPCGPAACYSTSQLSTCSGATLTRNRTVLGQLVGAGAYDIGHLALGNDGGGIAAVDAVGGYAKAEGCTGTPRPVGDQYVVDFVAHEMGHQFGATHTFEGESQGSCIGNRTPETSVEPGSGSSIMAYAGICGDEDLQAHSDPQFSQASQTQIQAYVTDQRSTDPADLQNDDEAQTVALGDFGSGDSFRLTYAGATTARITYAAYAADPAGTVERAIDAVLPADGSVDAYPYGGGSSYTYGFEVVFTGPSVRGRDLANMTVEVTGGTGSVHETDQGGPVDNQGAATTTANHNPSVTAPAARTIPVRTPFTLTGSGTDADGNALTYLWEQNDVGGISGSSLLTNAKKRGPLFRIFGDVAVETDPSQSPATGEHLPGTSPSRTFPDMAQVLAGTTNALTGACPARPAGDTTVPRATVDCYSEWLPTSAYVGYGGNASPPRLDFRLTARDSSSLGGGTAYADTTLRIDPTRGPLLVTSQPAGVAKQAGTTGNVTWAVNGTDALAATVRIGLSTDGGSTWRDLVTSTANDGKAAVTWPRGTSTSNARLRVSANGGYFFAVNTGPFAIGDFPSTTLSGGPADGTVEPSKDATFTASSSDPAATFQCRLDDAAWATCPSPLAYTGLSSTTHHLAVRAVGAGGTDPDPATRTWTVPVGPKGLTRAGGSWDLKTSEKAFAGSYWQSTTAGSTLTRRVSGVDGVYLIATKYRVAGSVSVYADGRLLRTIYLGSDDPSYRVRVRAADFATPFTGTVSVVTRSTDPVRVEGLGLPTG